LKEKKHYFHLGTKTKQAGVKKYFFFNEMYFFGSLVLVGSIFLCDRKFRFGVDYSSRTISM